MFVATADENYILARWAALNHLDLDFLWLGLHSIEKYLKAVLLLNGKSAKIGHCIDDLYQQVLSLGVRCAPLVKPPFLELLDSRWFDEPICKFLERLNKKGDPNNRYLLYGFYVFMEDLFKLDQVVWEIRRHCRPLIQTIQGGPELMEIYWIPRLRTDRSKWSLDETLPLEMALAGKRSLEVNAAVLKLNSSFAPDREHDYPGWRTTTSESPMTFWFRQLESDHAEVRQAAEGKFRWALESIKLSADDQSEIKAALGLTKKGGT